MLRNVLMLIVLSLACWPATVRAQEGLGVGVILGEPTGISLKTWLSRNTAFDLAAAWSFEDEGSFDVHGDYLIHNYQVFRVGRGAMPLYYGLGGRVRNRQATDPNVGIRIPVGVEYLFSGAPIDLFLEAVPVLDLTPETNVDVNASVGARYFFH
jgi:hypothetical protein